MCVLISKISNHLRLTIALDAVGTEVEDEFTGLATTLSSGIVTNSTIFSKNSNDNIKSKLETFRLAVKETNKLSYPLNAIVQRMKS